MLVLAVPSQRLRPGDYLLEIGAEGQSGARQRFELTVVGAR
jgi:hypothetical protein